MENTNYKNSDQQLIRRALKNDEEALGVLIKKYLKLVFSVANYYVKNSDDAQDVAQETFIKIWKSLESFQQEKNFSRWVFEITKNTSLDWLKKKRSIAFSDIEDENAKFSLSESARSLSPDPRELAEKRELASAVHSALAQLSPQYQEVVYLHDHKEMTFREIADSMGQPMNTMKSRYRRALIALKKFFKNNRERMPAGAAGSEHQNFDF